MRRFPIAAGDERHLRLTRAAFGLLALSAIGYQLTLVFGQADPKPENFFSFFTIQSNLYAACLLIALAARPAANRAWSGLRGAATLYLTITGIVYFSLLQDADATLGLTAPWVNTVLHLVMPVVLMLDWFWAPPSRPITQRTALRWVLFPAAYFVYSLARGYLVLWYPYPFLNPGLNRGYSGVLFTAAILAAVIAGLAVGVARVGNARRGHGPS